MDAHKTLNDCKKVGVRDEDSLRRVGARGIGFMHCPLAEGHCSGEQASGHSLAKDIFSAEEENMAEFGS